MFYKEKEVLLPISETIYGKLLHLITEMIIWCLVYNRKTKEIITNESLQSFCKKEMAHKLHKHK